MLPILQSDSLAEYDQHKFLKSLEALHRVQKQLWSAICQANESAPPPSPHCFEPGDKVWLKRHKHNTLEPQWKEPHTVILTTPMAVKVDRIRTRRHHSHVRPARRDRPAVEVPAEETSRQTVGIL